MITLRTYLRTGRLDAAGQSIIYFIIGDEWISSTCKVAAQYWDADNGIIIKKHPKYYTVNPPFQLYKSRAEQCISNYQTSGNTFNRKYFEQVIFGGADDANNPIFVNLITEYCNANNLGSHRILQYKGLVKDINNIQYNIRLFEINYSFGLKFQRYLRTKKILPNCENTVSAKLSRLKAIVHFAQKKELIQKDSLAGIKISEIKGTKKFLTAPELQVLEQLYADAKLNPVHQQILKYFLFSCYTGFRYSDIVQLKFYDIQKGCVNTTQEKTNKPVMVPLIGKAKALLDVGSIGLCFKTHSNQVSNRYLKDIMTIAGIDKKITYHCSRHTFGTLSIYWGIPKEVVAELMGVDFKTVEIYAKIMDEVKQREMLKWGKII